MKVIVTGARGALGQAVCRRYREEGHALATIDRTAAASGAEAGVTRVTGDLGTPEGARASVQAAADAIGGLDAVVHLAGGFDWKRVEDSAIEDWRRLFAANVETAVCTVQAALPRLADGGAIVLVGAASADPAGEGMAAYAAAKSAVARLVEALAKELAGRRIRVNAVLPLIIDTPKNRADMPAADPSAWTSPAAIADVIAFLTSPAARAINGALIPATNAA